MKMYYVTASNGTEPAKKFVYVSDSIHKVLAAFSKAWPNMDVHSVKCKHQMVYTA